MVSTRFLVYNFTRLAQSVERQPFKLVVVGSSPTSGRGRDRPLGITQKSQGNGDIKANKWQKRLLLYTSGDMGVVVRDITVLCGEGHNTTSGNGDSVDCSHDLGYHSVMRGGA